VAKRSTWIIVAAVVVVIAIVAASVYVFLLAPRNKLPVELWYNSDGHYGDTEDELATILKSSLEKTNRVQVTLKSDPWAVYRQNWVNQRMPVFLLGWYPDYFDTDDYVSPFLSTAGAASLGSFYTNSEVDALITQEQSTADPAARQTLFTQIQDKLADDVPYIPLFSGTAQAAYVSSVQNVYLHPVSFKWFIITKPGATELKGATTDKIISLDPASAYDYFSIEVINQVFDTLLVYEPIEAQLVAGLAMEVPSATNGGISADGKTYTYNLKPGITFHDGTPLTAQIVKDSIERVIRLDIAGSAAFLLYDVGALGKTPNIEVVDSDTVRFHLARPVSFFNDLMAFSVSAPVPPSYNQAGEQPSTVGSVIGTGPYRLTTHQADQLIVLEEYDEYYGGSLYASFGISKIPAVPKVSIEILGTATNLKQSIETKAVDVAYRTLNPDDLVDLQTRAQTLGLTVSLGASPQIRYLVINVNLVPDVRVRQAIAYLVDRALIDNSVFRGTVEPLYSMVPANMPYASPVFQARYGDANLNAANSILSQLGYAVPFHAEAVARDWF